VTGIAAGVFYGVVPERQAATTGRLADDHLALSLSLAVSVLVPIVTAVLLFVRRAAFAARPTRRSVLVFGAVVAAVGLVLVAAVVVVATAGHVVRDPIRMALTVLGPVAPVTLPAEAAHLDPILRTVVGLAGPLLWLTVAVAAIRPAWSPDGRPAAVGHRGADGRPTFDGRSSRDDRARARALLLDGGGDTFGWMTTWTGNQYWFAEDGRAAVAYRRSGRVAVTVGGPFGDPDARPAAMTGFARFCDDAGWTPVFYGIDERIARPLRKLGWDTLAVAEDADFDPRTWTTSGKKKQDVRTSVNRAAREGITAVWAPWSALAPAVVRQIEAISEEWVAERELPEMGFTLGGVDEMRDPEVRTLVALDAGGTVLAVTSWLPSFRHGVVVGWTLDVMRRRSDAPNGVMEFLVASAADQMRADGAERLSLSAAPLASTAGPDAPAPDPNAVTSLLELVGGVLEPVYGFRSLLRFKAKFGPDLHPLVMAYPDPVALPAIGIAVVRTYLPDLSVRQAVGLVRGR
jgi:phosphatidylglycerol lysyltransferase